MSKWSKELQNNTLENIRPGAMVKDEEHNYGFVTEIEPKVIIKEKEGIQSSIGFGSSISVAVNPCIYEWKAFFKSEEIFGDSIPLSENGQKEILYKFIKKYTQLPFEDVFEE